MTQLSSYRPFFDGLLALTCCVSLTACAIYSHPNPPQLPTVFSPDEHKLAKTLERHVATRLAVERNVKRHPDKLAAAAKYLEDELGSMGLNPRPLSYDVPKGDGSGDLVTVKNIEVTIMGKEKPREVIVVGAHYDSALKTPGANDNGSGVAAALEIAKLLKGKELKRTVRIVFFANEEETYFSGSLHNEWMGSRQYAKLTKGRKDEIVAMLSLETMGYFTDRSGSQCLAPRFVESRGRIDPPPRTVVGSADPITKIPLVDCWISGRWLGDGYDRGDFLAPVGNLKYRSLVEKSVETFRKFAKDLRAEGFALWEWLFESASWSDHRSFWEEGFPAIMVTDTAPARYPYYHATKDLPED